MPKLLPGNFLLLIVLAIMTIYSSLPEATAKASGENTKVPADKLVNLSRLGITTACASSVNGSRPLNDSYYGVLNLFDGGKNYINDINYSSWITAAQDSHHVKLKFDKPVTVYSLVIETTDKQKPKEFALELSRFLGGVKHIIATYNRLPVKKVKTIYDLPKPAHGVNELEIVLSNPGKRAYTIELNEIKVMGGVEEITRLQEQKPNLCPQAKEQHTIEVVRSVNNEKDLNIILAAESIYPSPGDIVKAGGKIPEEDDKKIWWYTQAGGIKIPWAITSGAIEYYRKLAESYRGKNRKNPSPKQSRFSYSASVDFRNNYNHGKIFNNVYVVGMRLSFYVDNGLSRVDFTKDRIVVMSLNGAVLEIFGDGPADLTVIKK